ncbi:hypothetical protein CUMW_197330 [Citrus unshiu]|nr:hypothetical protein CUMW_197330 [Citrus unshiu]
MDRRRWDRQDGRRTKKQKLIRSAEEELEAKLGYDLFSEGDKRLGWLLTFASSSLEDEDTRKVYSCIDLYFVSQDGSTFKSKYKFRPYFYAATKEKMEMDVEAYLRRRYESQIADIEILEKEDLDLKNHLSGLHKSYLKISFDTVQQLMDVKKDLLHVVERNQAKFDAAEAYESILTGKREQRPQDFLDCIVDLREYDVPYHIRFAIDNDVRCGQWYDVSVSSTGPLLEKRVDLLQRAEVHVCAFDIETTKLPLKFPDADYDIIMMISYMLDGQGYLIINRECVGEDIEDLEYTPKPEFEGYFKVTNVNNEIELLRLWFAHMQEVKPGIYVTYNGDYFDWPFLETRAAHHGFKMSEELGFQCDKNQGECRAKFACHLDCFAWVKRDSYLPQGSQGLKAVTKAKLGYDPLEVNPEDMVRFAKEKPQMMASYSVSDAVATYYLYMTYVHPFIFSLATIIPMSPDEVLRKGSGTLCEMLLMVQAYKANVICPNKHQSDPEKFYRNHLLESETYIGGHVECLESGQLLNNLDRDLQYAIKVEGKMDLESVSNYDEVKNAIMEKLLRLQEEPIREECPLIYHLDVAAMYPNIILTNRLQPPSIVTDEVCTACDFNRPGKTCLRKLEWVWRGEIFMGKRSDYYHLKKQIESEFVDGTNGHLSKSFLDLPKMEQQSRLKDRLKKYCQKAYKRVLDKPVTELREAGICMRENSFYVDTVRSFRDRRYEYKGLNKVWKGKLSEAKASGNSIKIQEAQDMVVLYDSLQLAHKCILNSFYGYVMRKGARWYSMEMAGVVTYTGAKIIQNARLLIEKIGKPLELDTDGIWCVLPGSFPENFTFKTKDLKKKLTISYPCVMLNVDVARNNTNDQYQTLVDPVSKTYETHSECSIEFEVDGPYKAMILPASKEEGILIKKRYAVFNDDGTLAELKGFEIKRRGELKLIKVFQAELFDKFLHGSTIEECYSAVAAVANRWLDLLDNQGKDIADSELIDYISESSTMSKSLADYGEQKSCAVTTARRLSDFLGDTMVKDKGLRCQYIVACEPQGTPVSERAVPVAIFETDAEIMKFYLRKWCKTSSDVGIRSIVDWSYYKQRLSSAIQKIITIPAAMQKVSNPVPRVVHPDWLYKKVREKEDKFRQRKLVDIFSSLKKDDFLNKTCNAETNLMDENVEDLEDFPKKRRNSVNGPRPIVRCFEVNNEQKIVKTTDQVDSLRQQLEPSEVSDQQPSSQNAIDTENIDRIVDYKGWLELKKRKWKDNLDRRKKQKLGSLRASHQANGVSESLGDMINHKEAQRRTGVGSYFRRQEIAMTRCHWQIIQLVPSSQSGVFLAWVVVEGIMVRIPITVPRLFYLSSKDPIVEKFPGRRVNKTLPHGRRSFNLIEVMIDEDQFRKESKKLAALLADPEVEVLGWQQNAAKIGMQRCAASSQWFNERISLARYAHILWISDDGVPDLGGTSEEDECFADEVHQPVLTYPGAYRKVSVELKIHHLSVNALLKSNQVNEMEGGGFPHSKLHDPVLHRILHKVIIDTGKFDLSAAKAYCDSLLKALQTRELFEWIELEPVHFWHSLLFMDQYNYGGIPARADESLDDDSQVDIVSSWNIAEYLPKEIQDHFVLVVSEFMYIPWKHAQKLAASRASLQEGSSCTPSITVAAAENFESHIVQYVKGEISSYFTGKLLSIVRDAIHHMKKMNNDQHNSPGVMQTAANIHKVDAPLEFIKHVCAAFALDQNVQHDVLVMRKNLLKYVRVREFAPEAEFRDPCPSFILPNVICSYCNDCRDLDLCRDMALLAQDWHCAMPQCGQPYDREVMENALLQIVRQRERLYHLQDLVCIRCNQVKAAHLAEQCACAGSFRCKEDASDFRSKMQIFLNIANRQGFQLLQECTSWILEVQ